MKRVVSIVLLLVVAVALPAAASTFLAMSQKDLLQHSEAVVQGQVLKVSSFWNSTGQIIVTEALVRVEETVAGSAPSVVVLRTFGGSVGGFTVEAIGFPTFRVNERMLLFLGPEKDGAASVIGYQQGQFRIVRNRAGEELAVPAVDGGSSILSPKGGVAPNTLAVPLAALKESIRAEARQVGLLHQVKDQN
jgi:hypothetical protein